MANDNKKSNKLVSEIDDDPTAELELLVEAAFAKIEAGEQVDAAPDASTFGFARLQSAVGDTDETITILKSDLKSRADSISKLQIDIEQLRSRWSGLEKEIGDREEITNNLTTELKATHKKLSRTDKLLKKRDKGIASLRSQLSAQEQTLQDSAGLIERSTEKEKGSQSRITEIQSLLDVAEEQLAALTVESRLERSEKMEAKEQARLLTDDIATLKKELSASSATVTELQEDIDCRKADSEKQDAQIRKYENKIDQLADELRNTKAKLNDDGTVHDGLNVRLKLLEAERDDLLKEITQLRKEAQGGDADRAEADRKLLAKQTGMLAGNSFEITELKGQIARTESYADELRRQVQNQLLLTDELQTQQKQLEISLTSANSQIKELSNNGEELRSRNVNLVEEKSSRKEEFEKELRQIRFELGEAKETIADRESINQQLTSDLVDTREFKTNLESQLSASDERNEAAIARLRQRLARLDAQNKELDYKLSTKDNAISALMSELSKRSEAIESIGEIEDVIHELDDRMSERIDDAGAVERERITRLLIGNIDGQKLRFPLFKNRLTIGRTGHNDIQLKAAQISRRHAVIVTDDDSTRIVDWGSKNGVFVNTKQIKEQILRNGDIVTIGSADFTFEERPKR